MVPPLGCELGDGGVMLANLCDAIQSSMLADLNAGYATCGAPISQDEILQAANYTGGSCADGGLAAQLAGQLIAAADAGTSCFDSSAASGCADLFAAAAALAQPGQTPSCKLLVGTGASGAGCTSDVQCASGLVCSIVPDAGSCVGSCASPLPDGAPCGDLTPCAQTSTCTNTVFVGNDAPPTGYFTDDAGYFCRPRTGADGGSLDRCEQDADCPQGTRCTGACSYPLALGATCYAPTDNLHVCGPGLACINNQCQAQYADDGGFCQQLFLPPFNNGSNCAPCETCAGVTGFPDGGSGGTCVPLGAEGALCSSDVGCLRWEFCTDAGFGDGGGACTLAVRDGGACEVRSTLGNAQQGNCFNDLFCVLAQPNDMAGVCRPAAVVGAGARCDTFDDPDECDASSSECMGVEDGGNVCEPYVQDGGSCGAFGQPACQPDALFCSQSLCVPFGQDGGDCSSVPCATGLNCVNNLCSPRQPDGTACNSPDQCTSGYCSLADFTCKQSCLPPDEAPQQHCGSAGGATLLPLLALGIFFRRRRR